MDQGLTVGPPGTYYRHSGRFSTRGVLATLGMGIAAAIVLGAVYALIDLYNPIAGWVTFLVTGGTGFAMAWVMIRGLRAGKIRNVGLVMLLTLVVAGVMYLMSWEVWEYMFIWKAAAAVQAPMPFSFWGLLSHPSIAWDILMTVNAKGAWSIGSGPPLTGIMLALVWLAEAAILFGVPFYLVHQAAVEMPFCEQCGHWCKAREVMVLNGPVDAQLRQKLEAKEFTALGTLGKAEPGATRFLRVYFQGCGDCDTTQTLSVERIELTRDKKGKVNRKVVPIVRRLNLTPEETIAVATVAADLERPPAESDAKPEEQNTTEGSTPATGAEPNG